MRAVDFITEALSTVRLGPQLFAPHPKELGNKDFSIVAETFALKPRARRWTSSAKQTANGITSAWVKWALENMPGWIGNEGILFDVAPSTKILAINSDRDAVSAAAQYGVEIKNIMDLFQKMPWQAIARDYDAVHYDGTNRSNDVYMSSWDVESTAWFDTAGLTNPRRVSIDRPGPKPTAQPTEKKPRFMPRRRR
jgi:hypothetical protein